ncbi:hypothetical protein [Winogradskyella sp.]|uniref:hypothetical protein n=1 Tax=Winogradskyella sp. TaxID=1883156 RepID=UPI003F6C5A52
MKKIKLLLFALVTGGFTILSCSSSDDSDNSSCGSYIDQPVQGSFRGEPFVSPEAYYTGITIGETTMYSGKIFVKSSTNGDCLFPTFDNGDNKILFPLPSLEVQTITLEEFGENTLNFNSIIIGEDGPFTDVELAECGTIEITNYDADNGILQGTIVAEGQYGSTVNGNFTLLLCDD